MHRHRRREFVVSRSIRGVVALCAVLAAGGSRAADEGLLGIPVEVPEDQRETRVLRSRADRVRAPVAYGTVSGFEIDPANRAEVLALYHCVYLASEGFETRMGWVGDVGACDAGTVSADFHDDTLRRINYYRAMVGLNADIAFDAVKNGKCQEAALIMSRNNGLSHDPIGEHPTWSCLTADGDEAAGKSNLSRGTGSYYTGPTAIDGQVQDNGVYNAPCGHRRWLLYARAQEMGNGGIPGEPGYSSSAAVWVIGDFAPPPGAPAWTSWPNAGYVPYRVVYPRWSFSLPGAPLSAFDTAVVTMSREGAPVSVVKVHPAAGSPAAGYGDPTVVWEPQGLGYGAPAEDTTYTVTVSGVVGAAQSSYTYDVVVVDPYDLGADVVISGPAEPVVGAANVYPFTQVDGAESCDLRTRVFESAFWTEGAEDAPPPQVVDGTSASYDLIQTVLVHAGSKAFHMAFPTWANQSFEIDRTILPGAASELAFVYRRRFSSTANEITAEVSTDDGASWTPVWAQYGICGGSCSSGDWDPAWIPMNVALGAYDGLPIRIRFVFAHENSAYLGVDSDYGVFFDDITVSAAEQLIDETVTSVAGAASSFVLTPSGPYAYLMEMRAELGCHVFEYGPVFEARAVPAPPSIAIVQIVSAGGNVEIDFEPSNGEFASYDLERTADLAAPWGLDPAAVYDAGQFRFTTAATPGAASDYFRVVGTP